MANEFLRRDLENPLRHAAKVAAVRLACAGNRWMFLNEHILSAIEAAVINEASRDEVVRETMKPPPRAVTR